MVAEYSNRLDDGPLEDLEGHEYQQECAGEDDDNVAGDEERRHGSHEDVVDLADLGELQGGWRAGEQEADDDENRVVQDGDGDVFRCEGEKGCHDDDGHDHSAED